MRQTTKILSIYCSMILLISCVPEKEGDKVTKHIIPLKKEILNENILQDYSSFIEIVSIIPLEETSLSSIQKVDKVIPSDSSYYILDRTSNKIFIFSKSGKFKYYYYPKDNSPISDFIITNNYVVAYSHENDALLLLDKELKFLSKKYINFKFLSFSYNEQLQKYIFDIGYNTNEFLKGYQLLTTDLNFNLLSKSYKDNANISWFLESSDGFGKLNLDNTFINNQTYYLPFFSNTLYSIQDTGNLYPEFEFDFGYSFLNTELITKFEKELGSPSDMYNIRDLVHSLGYSANRNFLALSFSLNKKTYHFFFNKLKKEGKLVEAPKDSSCGCGTLLSYKGFDNENLILSVNQQKLPSFIKTVNLSTKPFNQTFKSIGKQNPVLFLASINI